MSNTVLARTYFWCVVHIFNPVFSLIRNHYFSSSIPENKTTTLMTTPPVTMVTPTRTYIRCVWSNWLNTDTPDVGRGDFETITALKSTFGLCPNIVNIECRVTGSHTSVAVAGQNKVTCDAQNGLRCHNDEQVSNKCYDYEVRVLCWDDMCPTCKLKLFSQFQKVSLLEWFGISSSRHL